ncbi:MAG: chemotaxis protein CheW [Chloroflexaceae bacterium]|nr:chemotaxis protein CheW [Chloroflexaceae bacterium]
MTPLAAAADYFQVRLGTVSLLIPLGQAKEVLTLARAQVSPIPGVHGALLGVANHRGRLLWVLQLAQFLKLPIATTAQRRPQEKLTAVLLSLEERQLACIVSSLEGIVNFEAAALSSLQVGDRAIDPSYVSGHIAREGQWLSILNAGALFGSLVGSPVNP